MKLGPHLARVLRTPTAESHLARITAREECRRVLDVGCGTRTPLGAGSAHGVESVGLDASEAVLEQARAAGLHDSYIHGDIMSTDAEEILAGAGGRPFDVVIVSHVIEHLPRPAGHELLALCERLTDKFIVIETPNGFLEQGPEYGNPRQRHLSGWFSHDFEGYGYSVFGSGGTKYIRGLRGLPQAEVHRLVHHRSAALRPAAHRPPAPARVRARGREGRPRGSRAARRERGARMSADGAHPPPALPAGAKVLVTGGFGFLGGHVVEALVHGDVSVHVVDDLSSNPVPVDTLLDDLGHPAGLTWDVTTVAEYMQEGPGDFDWIVHLASVVGPAGILSHGGRIVSSIVSDTYLLADYALERGRGCWTCPPARHTVAGARGCAPRTTTRSCRPRPASGWSTRSPSWRPRPR